MSLKIRIQIWKKKDAAERRGRIIFGSIFLIQKVLYLLQKVYTHTPLYFLAPFTKKSLETISNPIAMSIPSTQTVFLKYHFLLKETRFLEEMTDSRSGAGNVQDKPGTPHHF